MNVNELIEQLRKLPKEVREQPIMDGKPNVGYRLKAIETTDSEEFVDIAYKLGLFLTEGEDD